MLVIVINNTTPRKYNKNFQFSEYQQLINTKYHFHLSFTPFQDDRGAGVASTPRIISLSISSICSFLFPWNDHLEQDARSSNHYFKVVD